MSKPLRKSHTAQAATVAFLTLLIQTGYSLWDPDLGSFRTPTQIETGAVIAGAFALKETLEGRKKATEAIEGTEAAKVETSQIIIPESIQDSQEDEVDLSILSSEPYKIKALRNTVIKTSTNDSSVLTEDQKTEVLEGQEFSITAYKFLDNYPQLLEVELAGITYYLFIPHIELYNNSGDLVTLVEVRKETIEAPTPTSVAGLEITKPKIQKTPITLPGYKSTFYLEDPVIPNGNFTWSEVTHGGVRLPLNKSQVDNAIRMVRELQNLREFLGNKPMRVTSFGRPEPFNSRAGGARNSYHLTFQACDFFIPGMNIMEVQRRVLDYWIGRKIGGVGKAAAKLGIVHLDLGPVRDFPY